MRERVKDPSKRKKPRSISLSDEQIKVISDLAKAHPEKFGGHISRVVQHLVEFYSENRPAGEVETIDGQSIERIVALFRMSIMFEYVDVVELQKRFCGWLFYESFELREIFKDFRGYKIAIESFNDLDLDHSEKLSAIQTCLELGSIARSGLVAASMLDSLAEIGSNYLDKRNILSKFIASKRGNTYEKTIAGQYPHISWFLDPDSLHASIGFMITRQDKLFDLIVAGLLGLFAEPMPMPDKNEELDQRQVLKSYAKSFLEEAPRRSSVSRALRS